MHVDRKDGKGTGRYIKRGRYISLFFSGNKGWPLCLKSGVWVFQNGLEVKSMKISLTALI